MEDDDKRKKKVWKKKTKQVKSTADHPSLSSQITDSVDQIHVVGNAKWSRVSKTVRDLNQPNVNGNGDVSIDGNDKEPWIGKQAEMEAIIADLQSQNDLLLQKENMNAESLDRLNCDNSQLSLQVMELEKSQINLFEENKKLVEKISSLQSQIQTLERITSSNNISTENTEVACGRSDGVQSFDAEERKELLAVVEKLMAENSKLLNMVDEYGAEKRSIDSALLSDPTAHVSEEVGSTPEVPPGRCYDQRRDERERESETEEREGGGSRVPLTDAPLIGAPFRLVSFVARYVSGADLVVSIKQ